MRKINGIADKSCDGSNLSLSGCIFLTQQTTSASVSDSTFGNVTEAATSTTKVTSKIERTSNSQTDNAISLTTKIQENTTTSTTKMTRSATTLEESSSITTVGNNKVSQASAVRGKYYYFIIFKSKQSLLYLHVT